jgi:hypothetical protein
MEAIALADFVVIGHPARQPFSASLVWCLPVGGRELSQQRYPPGQVLVFSTSVESQEDVMTLSSSLDALAGYGRWNFALDDCDRILRIVSDEISPAAAIELLQAYGFECHELLD